MNANLTSFIHLAHLSAQHDCKMIAVGSVIGYTCNKNYELYHISKQAVQALKKLKVQVINPPTIRDSGFFKEMPKRSGFRKLGAFKMFSASSKQIAEEIVKMAVSGKKVVNVGLVGKLARIASIMQ
ncbi:Short-chain_dehydrogenase/reductase [Hexamita inflata]|uniref:Short-chain dehydrogenase/reductase n=1 Tax=Hexamita inflata TaxID=28002 RepID=A0AA86TY61_9EUKA|nr:Short-chain dehydrogenase/reductase [Hexamita inflata]